MWSVDGVGGGYAAPVNIVIAPGSGNAIPTPPPQESAPVLSPPIASNLPVTVSISGDPQARIYYTTDGTLPTQTSPQYTSPLTINAQTTLRARAFRTGYLPSVSALGEYVAQTTLAGSLLLVRNVSGNGSFLPTVSITATPQGNLSCYTVSESVLPGLTPTGLSADAVWNPATGTINWGPYFDGQPRVFTYDLVGPTGTYPLGGEGSFDGYGAADSGVAALSINDQSFGPVSTNELGCTGAPLDFSVAVDPAPGVITVTSASGTVEIGATARSPRSPSLR